MTEPRPFDPERPEPALMRETAQALLRGRVVAAPSDTVYGFLASADSPEGLAHLQRLKERAGPFLRLAADAEQVLELCDPLPEILRRRLRAVWPGPVTVILPATGHAQGLAFRVPRAAWLRELVKQVGACLLSTSANPPGRPEPQAASEVSTLFPELDLILDGGRAATSRPSTLVDCRSWPGRVVREGAGDPGPLLPPD